MSDQEPRPNVDVLIADDDALTRQLFRLILENHGYGCVEAADGREAVEIALRDRPGCALLDVAMPVMGGIEAARTLRANSLTRPARIHFVTGLADSQTRALAREAGGDLYLVKPVNAEDLLAACAPIAGEPGEVTGLTASEAESLLDWLEKQHCTALAVDLREDGFTVRCVCPAGLRLVVGENKAVRLARP
jgi:CheY-like chemotaxis protein